MLIDELPNKNCTEAPHNETPKIYKPGFFPYKPPGGSARRASDSLARKSYDSGMQGAPGAIARHASYLSWAEDTAAKACNMNLSCRKCLGPSLRKASLIFEGIISRFDTRFADVFEMFLKCLRIKSLIIVDLG